MNRLYPSALLFITTVALFAVSGSFEMLNSWDDDLYIKLNETIKAVTLNHLKESFTNYYVGNYAPINILSFMMDYAVWGLNPVGYHLENVLLHALNGVLFYRLLRTLNMTEWQAFAAAWIFLFHPVQVESVAWISQRKNLLAMLFFLTALIAYHTYNQKSRKLHLYLLTLFSMLAATLSKSIAVIFPAVVLLHDYLLRTMHTTPLRKRKSDIIPFFIIAGTVSIMAFLSQSKENMGGRTGYPGGSPYATFLTMTPVIAGYLRDCFSPFNLSPFYIVKIRTEPDFAFILASTVLAITVALGLYIYRNARPLLFWYGLFFMSLLPVMQIIPIITLKHDRYLYFPLLGFSVLVVYGVNRIINRSTVIIAAIIKLLMVGVLVSLPVMAFQQTLYWRNDVTLWTRAVEIEPENRLGWRMLAMAYTRRGDAANAYHAFKRISELRDKYGQADERDLL